MRGTRGATRSRGQRLLYPPPSLDLRFAETKSLTDWISGQNLITFTRVSSATTINAAGAVETVAAGLPRFDHNPLTGESLGLLVEEARTNLLLRSEEIATSPWGTNNAGATTYTANAAIAPSGTLTADRVTASADFSGPNQFISVTSNLSYAFSFYVKAATAGSLDVIRIECLNGRFASFNITTKTFSGVNAAITPSFVDAGNGWVRVQAVFTAPATASYAVSIYASTSSDFYLWGAQLEAGAFPTSYIPTTSAAATRSADVASITGSNFSSWYRQDEGTVFAEGSVVQPVTAGNQFFFRTSDNGYNNSIALNIQSTGFISLATSAAGVFDGSASSIVSLPANTAAKFIGAYAANNLGASLNGTTVATDLSATMPTTLNRLDIGSDHLGLNRIISGTIRRLTYWPQRLPNNTLIALTR